MAEHILAYVVMLYLFFLLAMGIGSFVGPFLKWLYLEFIRRTSSTDRERLSNA